LEIVFEVGTKSGVPGLCLLASFRLASRPKTDGLAGKLELAPTVEPEEGRLFGDADLHVWSPFFPVMVTGPEHEDPEAIFDEADESVWAIAPAQAKTITQPKSVMALVIANLLVRGMLPLRELAFITLFGSQDYLEFSTRIGAISAS
jgi:hypothetical protein